MKTLCLVAVVFVSGAAIFASADADLVPLRGTKKVSINFEAFRLAIKQKESGAENSPYQAWGDQFRKCKHKCKTGCLYCCKSFGAYQTGKARYSEAGLPYRWPYLNSAQQDEMMRNLSKNYYKAATDNKMSSEQSVIKYMARCHNGWGSASIAYANAVWQMYKEKK